MVKVIDYPIVRRQMSSLQKEVSTFLVSRFNVKYLTFLKIEDISSCSVFQLSCKTYIPLPAWIVSVFCAGCFALPLLWIANLWYFRDKIFDDQTSNILKRWLHLSLIGSSLAAIGLISWITYFQLTITSWDESFLVYRSPPLQNITNSTTPVIDQMLYWNSQRGSLFPWVRNYFFSGKGPLNLIVDHIPSWEGKILRMKYSSYLI